MKILVKVTRTYNSLEVPRRDQPSDEGDSTVNPRELNWHVHLHPETVVAPTQCVVDEIGIDKVCVTLRCRVKKCFCVQSVSLPSIIHFITTTVRAPTLGQWKGATHLSRMQNVVKQFVERRVGQVLILAVDDAVQHPLALNTIASQLQVHRVRKNPLQAALCERQTDDNVVR